MSIILRDTGYFCDRCDIRVLLDHCYCGENKIVLTCRKCWTSKEFIVENRITYDVLSKIIQRNLDYWRNDKESLRESLTRAILCELKKTNRRSLKEVLGKAIDKAEQKMQAENVKQRPQNTVGFVPPKSDTFTFSSGKDYDIKNDSRLKECARALADKLDLIEKDGRCANIFVFAANHGCTYSGPDYEKELKDLKKVLNEDLCS